MTVYLSRIAFNTLRSATQKCFSANAVIDFVVPNTRLSSMKNDMFSFARQLTVRTYASNAIQQPVSLENDIKSLKKKVVHTKAKPEDLSAREGHYLTMAYATANSYDLKGVKEALVQQKLYEPAMLLSWCRSGFPIRNRKFGGVSHLWFKEDIKPLVLVVTNIYDNRYWLKVSGDVRDVVVANAVYSVGSEPREIIIFKEGSVVFWNCSELEANNVLEFIRPFEVESYPRDVVEKEREVMTYVYQTNSKKCHLQESSFVLVKDRDNSLERYTFSHAMVQSARLGAFEAQLEALATSVSAHTAAMQRTGAAHVDKKVVVRKLGEIFSLRHRLNIESDLLDTPDFYWEEEQLERLYSSTVAYFTIPRRTRVLNERLSHCVELLELLSSWAADRHHVRLEWMVIALILAEVMFELLHLFERWVVNDTQHQHS